MKLPRWKTIPGNVIGRAAVLVPLALALWWFLLKSASLGALRILAWLPLAVTIAPPGLVPIRVASDGEWLCNVEVNTMTRNPQTGQTQHVDSIEVAIRDSDVAEFASGWFTYLALALSTAPFSRKQVKHLAWGLAIQTVVNTLSLAAYVYIVGYGTLINSPGSPDARIWWVKYFDHLNSLVVPFASPFLIAMLVHPEWREYAGLRRPVKTETRASAKRLARPH